ncbi:pentapeptide repeat-containing protein [Sorangium cellulosum]
MQFKGVQFKGVQFKGVQFKGVQFKGVQFKGVQFKGVQFKGDWFLFYHENALSGKTHLRSVEIADLTHSADGTIPTIDP